MRALARWVSDWTFISVPKHDSCSRQTAWGQGQSYRSPWLDLTLGLCPLSADGFQMPPFIVSLAHLSAIGSPLGTEPEEGKETAEI